MTYPKTFEEWVKAHAVIPAHGIGAYQAAEIAWHARDAEIADLKRQLTEQTNKPPVKERTPGAVPIEFIDW